MKMNAILIKPKNETDFELINSILKRLKVKSKIMRDEELEDLGLSILMTGADRTKKVSEESILRKLRK
jgi:hypothetical protein